MENKYWHCLTPYGYGKSSYMFSEIRTKISATGQQYLLPRYCHRYEWLSGYKGI